MGAPCSTCSESSSWLATILRFTISAITTVASTIQRTKNGRKSIFIIHLQVGSQSNLRPQSDGGTAHRRADLLLVECLSGGLFDGIHHQEKVGIERALDLLARFAGAVAGLIGTDRTDVPADGLQVRVDVVALHRLNGLGHLRKEPEKSATGGFLQAALAVGCAFRTNAANPVSDNRF